MNKLAGLGSWGGEKTILEKVCHEATSQPALFPRFSKKGEKTRDIISKTRARTVGTCVKKERDGCEQPGCLLNPAFRKKKIMRKEI